VTPEAPGSQQVLHPLALHLAEVAEVARHQLHVGHVRVAGEELALLGLVGVLAVVERVRLGLGGGEARIGEVGQLAHAPQVMVAQQQHGLVRRVRREPCHQPHRAGGSGIPLVGLAPVEVVPHGDELHLGPQPALLPEQPMALQQGEDAGDVRLRVPHGDAQCAGAPLGRGGVRATGSGLGGAGQCGVDAGSAHGAILPPRPHPR